MSEPINRFDVQRKRLPPRTRRLPYGGSHPALMQLKDPRALVYRVVTMRGQIGVDEFPNAWSALAHGHECRLHNLWWVEARIGVE
jgi:hypothetical protein